MWDLKFVYIHLDHNETSIERLVLVGLGVLSEFFIVQSLGIALCHGIDNGEDKIYYHNEEQVAKELLQPAGFLKNKTKD